MDEHKNSIYNLLAASRHIIQKGYAFPMPGLMIAVSGFNVLVSNESYARMKEIEKGIS